MLKNVRIVLIQTFHPGNIGSVARAMKTMGLSELILVNPRSFPDEEATRLAAGATDVLDNAQVVNEISDAVSDCVQVTGASARVRGLPLTHYDEADVMAREMVKTAHSGPVALIFGRERFGLTNEELRHCTHQLTLPANPDYPVLNLSQAVQVCTHELFTAWRRQPESGFRQARPRHATLPTQQQMQYFQEHLETALSEAGFFNQPHARTRDRLRAFFQRARPSRKELSLLRGVINALNGSSGKQPASQADSHDASREKK
ncbi:RNA methyltransferase [Kushneria phosphatilytica]|uniref:tRNA (cytidine/uridine-2'-O-)-methyltransferase TrmJ n=1 Tax=Kushneria phosphatilytica TaxID=657387 RepID=A0A1S1NXP4_9GAMM|nr:RNA methyltransferase [Kushneria phosphatilytica]OHV12207.1 RNA methyltransferase [Kushneria phosphatilytica]QEL11399.1 RNA methyltransferase [Kushneria phosphatilytica]